MPELENPEAKLSDAAFSILAGYLRPKHLAPLGVRQRTIERWRHFRQGPPRVVRPQGPLPP